MTTENNNGSTTGSTDLEAQLREIEERAEKAFEMVSALCKPRGSEGSREWLMSIPAQPDYDPDLVIGRSLMDNRYLIAQVRALSAERDGLENTVFELMSHWIRLKELAGEEMPWTDEFAENWYKRNILGHPTTDPAQGDGGQAEEEGEKEGWDEPGNYSAL